MSCLRNSLCFLNLKPLVKKKRFNYTIELVTRLWISSMGKCKPTKAIAKCGRIGLDKAISRASSTAIYAKRLQCYNI